MDNEGDYPGVLNAKSGVTFFLSRVAWVILLLIVIGAVLRLPNLGESLWFDEVEYSAKIWQASLSDLLQ